MCRRINPPYRLFSLDERIERFRPVFSALEEAEPGHIRSSARIRDRPTRVVYKRDGRIHYVSNQASSAPILPTNNETEEELQIIPAEEWARHPNRHVQWQAEEPQIVITSDVQLQTDEMDVSEWSDENISTTSDQDQEPESCHRIIMSSYYSRLLNARRSNVSLNSRSPTNYLNVNFADRATQIPSIDDEDFAPDSEGSLNVCPSSPVKSEGDLEYAPVLSLKLLVPTPTLPPPTLESRQVAHKVIRHARSNKTLNTKEMHCQNCDLFPILPVTGQCGHTRCTKCIQECGDCPCGAEASKTFHVNTVIQYIIGKMVPNELTKRESNPSRYAEPNDQRIANLMRLDPTFEIHARPLRMAHASATRSAIPDVNVRMPMPPRVQFEHARRLVSRGRYRDAAPHFARVAASSEPFSKNARVMLAQVIRVLTKNRDPRHLTRELFRSVRMQAASSWLRPEDLECVLCFHTFVNPVTTPCGHTYCRTCIERALDYKKVCALCLRPLDNFNLSIIRENKFVMAALEAIDVATPAMLPDPNIIPIFVCTVAYPSIPCPLFIFDPRHWLMIRRVLESGSRKFGMVAYEGGGTYSNYGTLLEVCDCVHLEDGRLFLSTIGLSRFRVISRDVNDGCDVARIQTLVDIPVDSLLILHIRMLGSQILYKALMWMESMSDTVRLEIETAFGQIPKGDQMQTEWWNSPDGPAWLWWLIAILPLRSEIKVLILSTKNLVKRMLAVSRTLQAIDQVSITTTSTSECEIRSALTNAEEWLERGS